MIAVAVNLVTAVALGVAIAVVLALRSVSRSAGAAQVPLDPSDHDGEEHALLSEHIVAYRIGGPLFFAAAHRFLLELTEIADIHVVILRLAQYAEDRRASAPRPPGLPRDPGRHRLRA